MAKRRTSVLISGIGIAGSTLAYWLDRRGFDVTLVERAPGLRSGGYLIDFWGLGYDVAERMHLVPQLLHKGYQVDEVRFVDDRGRRVGGFGAEVFRRMTGGRFVSISRSDLAGLIYQTIENRCEINFGDTLFHIEQHDDRVQVTFQHGRVRQFDLVIGADGLHSQVRRLAFGKQDLFEKYLGYMVAAFDVDHYRPRDENVYVSYSLPGRQVARYAVRNDRTMFWFVFAADQPPAAEAHDTPAHQALLRATFADAGWECPRILAAMDEAEDLYFDRVSQIRMRSWSRGRIALIGDAAFAPSLLAGQGAALAMTAAYVLAGELAEAAGRHEQAFVGYQEKLGKFIAGKQASAEQFAGSFAPKTHLGVFFRNQITKLFRIPAVANFFIGRGLLDRLALPDYPVPADSGV